MRVALKKMLVFSLKACSLDGSFERSVATGPACRQASEKFEGSSLRPSGWPQPPLRACDTKQTTPGTFGSSKALTQTLSFGDSRLKVVLMQGRSSALAVLAATTSAVAAAAILMRVPMAALSLSCGL